MNEIKCHRYLLVWAIWHPLLFLLLIVPTLPSGNQNALRKNDPTFISRGSSHSEWFNNGPVTSIGLLIMNPLFLCNIWGGGGGGAEPTSKQRKPSTLLFLCAWKIKFWKLLIAILLPWGDLLPMNGANTKEANLKRRERERDQVLNR